jgi:hypothetical protein
MFDVSGPEMIALTATSHVHLQRGLEDTRSREPRKAMYEAVSEQTFVVAMPREGTR